MAGAHLQDADNALVVEVIVQLVSQVSIGREPVENSEALQELAFLLW